MAIELTTVDPAILNDIRGTLGIYNQKQVFPELILRYAAGGEFSVFGDLGTIINFRPLQDASTINVNASLGGTSLSAFEGAEYLVNLQNLGTAAAININGDNFNATTLNALFSALPTTTKTATINVGNNPGAATCDPSIATAKGYTVVTASS